MKRLPVLEEDQRSIADWFVRWGELVGNVDFKRVREIFVEDAVAFGSKVEMVTSRDALEQEQWRPIWPTMADYRYDLSTLEVIVSPDRLMAMGSIPKIVVNAVRRTARRRVTAPVIIASRVSTPLRRSWLI